MTTIVSERATARPIWARVSFLSRERGLEWIGLAAIVALAAVLRFANLEALGDANHYYAAAVKAMLQSWHNFFFAAAEPGGSVSVDKPPVGLWLQVISAYFFGVNTLGLLLPELLAGIASVVVVFYVVRKGFGAAAGLLAALVLAITPVAVATDRNNTIDSTLILTLLLAAWAFMRATEGQSRYLFLGAALVGIGFNIKMLQAYLPLPAFYALYFLGSKDRLLAKAGKLSMATVLLLVVSLSWATVVDLTPADKRPYVGSSRDNSEMSLIVGYNGLERLLGMGGRGGLLGALLNGSRDGRVGNGGPAPDGRFPPPPALQAPPAAALILGGAGGGFPGTGRPGALRLFAAPLSKEASWFLPFGLFSALLLVLSTRLRWPLAPKHQALVLWGSWLVIGGIFFSIAGFFHEYYLSMLAPPLAALVGIGAIELWRLRAKHAWLALVLLLVPAAATLWLQQSTASAFVNAVWWMPLAVALVVIGALLLLPPLRHLWNQAAVAGFVCVLAALLMTPGVWSVLTTLHSSANQSLPAAYDGRSSGPANRGRSQVDPALLDFVQARTQNVKYLMAVPSSMQGADYVLATGRPVLYLGGFMGQDRVVTSADLTRMVADGELRYIYWDGRGGGFGGRGPGGQPDISTWITNACVRVRGFDTTTRNSGAPDGTTTNPGPTFQRGPGALQVSLYDCGHL